MGYFTSLGKELDKYLEPEQIELVHEAYLFACEAHKGQKRRSGEAYVTHPIAAATILAKMRMDYQSIIATLLHDVLEDTGLTKEELADSFGEDIAELVDGVSKLTQISFESRAEAQAENFRKMILAMVRDIRVILVKLADRLHNMRTLGVLPPKKRRRIARETIEIYAPIANRLGMHSLYIELENLGFQALYPMRYRILNEAVKKAHGDRQRIIDEIEATLKTSVKKQNVVVYSVYGRQKHLYSIYKKMRTKHSSFSDIMDVYGFRIVVDSVDACYRVLGIVHNLFKPVPERFKDYIAIPKVNGYQSLHTTLFGPYGVPLEIQIRTEDMDKVAENGIAAHWLYKSTGLNADEAQARVREWVKGLLEIQQSAGSSLEFIENVKIDLFPDEVYVFTPKGDILELPKGATPVDFAFAVHSDIGNSCVAAKVNRHLAPLSVPLMNGQTVEIITAPSVSPNPAWLNFVVTAKARSNIRHFLKTQQESESIELGKRLLERALDSFGMSLKDIDAKKLKTLVAELNYSSVNVLYGEIGLGNQVALLIAKRLLVSKKRIENLEGIVGQDEQHPLQIKGTEGMVVRYATCCRPIPGDPIVGCIRAGYGITVHEERCEKVAKFRNKPERFVNMAWEDDIEGTFKVDLTAEVINQRGVLAQLAGAVSAAEADIDNITVDPRDGECSRVQLTIVVRDRLHLARVMRRIRAINSVTRLIRGKKGAL
ncbi:MAG: bifunctional GTP diphosphokinase/guanosine-3',5'-bis pyrophosphate 3'-pyrophosphohydrolase [Proteobacteria bacterium]|nr:bifunctional GTP diphosphokinase/guanosine-3',5'-bis pyrophosphate 3'-pyrophosphohydrolase [Pseudomonadota bacterium]